MGIIMIFLLSFLSVGLGQTVFDYARNYTEAFMTGYEDPDYVFPYSSCLPLATQTAITDKIIGIIIFVSGENWAQAKIVEEQLVSILETAAKACDLDEFYTNFKNEQDYSVFSKILKLWWNSVLLYRSCPKFYDNMFKDNYQAFYYLGECAKFLYPSS